MITGSMPIKELLEKYPECAEVLTKYDMGGCMRCLAANYETLAEGIEAHGHDVDEVIGKLNESIKR
jgi:hybrid cluster-associated redox disulfide protein